jgi:methylglyoxal synthase
MGTIALIAHDRVKDSLVDWVKNHIDQLQKHHLIATHHTGTAVQDGTGLEVELFEPGPMGGDIMIANAILTGQVEKLIFFVDSLSPMAHDPDIRSLIRIATIKNIPFALNGATADYLFREDSD